MSQPLRIDEYMTPLPHVVDAEQTQATAARRMAQLGVRHLPVTQEGRLVGVVSERDLDRARSGRGLDPDRAQIADAMTPDPFAVPPDATLAAVVREMAARRVGSCVVVEGEEVVGLLTTTDALELFADALTGYLGPRALEAGPAEVRERVLKEHGVIRELLRRAELEAERALGGDEEGRGELLEAARQLYRTLLRHVALEDRILAPALREGGAEGRRLADALLSGHASQRRVLREALRGVDAPEPDAETLAERLLELIGEVREDMAHEERDVVTEGRLRDDPVRADVFTG